MVLEKIKIKKATKKDVGIILAFIKKIAEYEKLLHEVKADEKTLERYLFGRKRYAECIIAYLDKEPVAFALYFFNFSTFVGKPGIYLEDVFVNPEHRGKGIGTMLIKYLAKLAKKNDFGRMEWIALNWNKKAIDFYKNIGARPMDEWILFRMNREAIDNFAK